MIHPMYGRSRIFATAPILTKYAIIIATMLERSVPFTIHKPMMTPAPRTIITLDSLICENERMFSRKSETSESKAMWPATMEPLASTAPQMMVIAVIMLKSGSLKGQFTV